MAKMILLLGLIFYSSTGATYIDPGIVSVAYQYVYFLIFSFFAIFIFKPFTYIKMLIRNFFKKEEKDKIDI